MSNEDDPANLVVAVIVAVVGLFACLIIGGLVIDVIQGPTQNTGDDLLTPPPSP